MSTPDFRTPQQKQRDTLAGYILFATFLTAISIGVLVTPWLVPLVVAAGLLGVGYVQTRGRF